MMHRRDLFRLAPLSAFALSPALLTRIQAQESSPGGASESIFTTPPVVQLRNQHEFTVTFGVSGLATGWVEWGSSADKLDHKAISANHGLICADDRVLGVRVDLGSHPPDAPLFYRIVAQPLSYQNAYNLERGEAQQGELRELKPWPAPGAERVSLVVINDTHENAETLARLGARIEALDPDLLVWNGDTCNNFDANDNLVEILLGNGRGENGPESGGWASTRPLLLTIGNHDIRGEHARELPQAMPGHPGLLPYNADLILGKLRLLCFDTGEDKPDAHPTFAGTAAYEPYREAQSRWLDTLSSPSPPRPWCLAFAHIPLRGLKGQLDGTTMEGYARWSGQGSALWLPKLSELQVNAIVSGHTHRWRIDEADETTPMQIVGGGPTPEQATLIRIEASADELIIVIENLDGEVLEERNFTA